ncbi:MFS transporter [Actinosynnema sp. ALI-1.44]|uniref:MFS transporter n=1 Tax=Actinosynnema sp. ALI-1.44 TaxID=1933779 RepID=UPI00097BC496|nr:MFS transporter [Actinosynnema sp. ALI-1.44]ONI81653.1 MFS transporter [Actinosynnema sp. ALI-1.44]
MTTSDETTRSSAKAWLGVVAITASLFTFVTTELMPIGLLTPMGATLGVPTGTAALMVTLFGISAGLGVPFIVGWTRRADRRLLLSALLVVLAVGNLITAAVPNYPLLLATRLVMGFAHGVFWAIGVSMAMRIVEQRHASRAAAVVMSGMSIATVVGIPLGTFLEDLTSWQTTFYIWSGLSALVFLAVAALVPPLPSQGVVSVREVFGLPIKNVRLRAVMITVMLYVLGHFGVYTFIRPFVENNATNTAGYLTVALVVFGLGGAVGNVIAGHTVNKNLRVSFLVSCGGLLASMLLLLTISSSVVGLMAAVGLWGISFGAANLSQINMTLAAAPDAFEAAMAINTLQYNLSIALGAFFGGLVVDGLGLTSVVWFGVILTGASLLVALAWHRAPATSAGADQGVTATS